MNLSLSAADVVCHPVTASVQVLKGTYISFATKRHNLGLCVTDRSAEPHGGHGEHALINVAATLDGPVVRASPLGDGAAGAPNA